MTRRPRVLFGEHSTQRPAIERLVDRDRFDVAFAAFDEADFAPFDLVVPLRLEEFAAARRANADRRRAVLPSPELVELCDDKLLFNRRLIALGFGDAIPALLPDDTDAYPFVRKVRRGDFGAGIRMVRGAGDDALVPDSFAQVAVAGTDEYVLHLLRVDAAVRYSLCYRYDMGDPLAIRGGAQGARGIHPADPEPARATCLAILDALGFEGTCCFNYKLEADRPMILELNPRFGGSLVGDVTGYVAAHLDAIA
jgi:carbamoylphosphate synthase large subunit